MDIRNWPLDKIMQLPDCCFGRRWPISVSFHQPVVAEVFDISKTALPEKCVIWEVFYYAYGEDVDYARVALALGDQLPADMAAFDLNEQIIHQLGRHSQIEYLMYIGANSGPLVIPLKIPLAAGGRRLIGRFENLALGFQFFLAGIVVSSVPTEVPDWLISGHLRSL